MMTRTWIVMLALAAGGCAMRGTGNPNQQMEGHVAFHARQVINMADTALTLVDILAEQRLAAAGRDVAKQEQIKADARAVITVFKQVGEYGQKLAAALAAVDASTTDVERRGAIQSAQAIMAGMNRLVQDGAVPVGDEPTRAVVLRLFGNLSDLLLQLAFVLPQPGR